MTIEKLENFGGDARHTGRRPDRGGVLDVTSMMRQLAKEAIVARHQEQIDTEDVYCPRLVASAEKSIKGSIISVVDPKARRAVLIVAIVFIAYFVVEVIVALAIGSASVLADSTDFLEDACFNILVYLALSWSAINRARVGMLLSMVLFLPSLAFVWEAGEKLIYRTPPEPFAVSLAGCAALAITVGSALFLAYHRRGGGSLTRAAFLSVRTHAFANIAIIAAGIATAYVWQSIWPDLVVGMAITLVNLDAAREIWQAARTERLAIA